MHYSRVVIVLFSTEWYDSTFSTYSFGKTRFSSSCVLVFLYFQFLVFLFYVLNSRSSPKILITFLLPGSKINNVLFNIILILFKRSVEIKEPCYKKTCFQIGFIKKNLICKEKSEIVTEVKLVMKIRKHNHLYFRTLVLALYYSRGDNA